MTDSVSVALQKALYAALSADTTLKSKIPVVDVDGQKVISIFDKVPQAVANAFTGGNAPTYLTIGDVEETPRLLDEPASTTEHILSFAIASQTIGMIEAKNIRAAIESALATAFATLAAALADAGYGLIQIDPHSARFSRSQDGVTTLGVVRMRALTEPLAF